MKQFDDYQAIVAQAVLSNESNKLSDYTAQQWAHQINSIALRLREEAVRQNGAR